VAAGKYLVFLSKPSGYELVERDGEPPQVGDELEESGLRLLVTKVAVSPLPADARLCAYSETLS
jgi:hypothetical protein